MNNDTDGPTYIARDTTPSGSKCGASAQQSLRGSLDIRSRCMREGSGADEVEPETAQTVICRESSKYLHMKYQNPE